MGAKCRHFLTTNFKASGQHCAGSGPIGCPESYYYYYYVYYVYSILLLLLLLLLLQLLY